MASPAPARRAVAVLNQKGGVGKTTVTLGLAAAAADAGRRVLVVDLDPQASSTWVLGHEPDGRCPDVAAVAGGFPIEQAIVPSTWSDRVELVPGSPNGAAIDGRRLRAAFASLPSDRYAAVLVDCPPTLGAGTRTALVAVRQAVVVVDPSALGLRGIGGIADTLEEVWERDNPDLELAGVVLNRVPAISSEADRRVDELARIVGGSTVWKPAVPQRVIVNQALGERRPIHAYGARSADVSRAFDALWARLRRAVA